MLKNQQLLELKEQFYQKIKKLKLLKLNKTQIEEAAEALVEAKLVFEVHTEATKSEIKKAVEEFFKVKVAHVRTANFKGKEKRFGRTLGRRNDWKKAVVTLKEGERLDLV